MMIMQNKELYKVPNSTVGIMENALVSNELIEQNVYGQLIFGLLWNFPDVPAKC